MVTQFISIVVMGQQYFDRSWQSTSWQADDREYRAIRATLESELGNKSRLDAIITASYKKCMSPQVSNKDLFRWGTAILLRCRDDWDYGDRVFNDHTFKLPYWEQFPRCGDSKSYEYTRMRFMFTVGFDFPHPELLNVGEALLKKNPNDVPVLLNVLKLRQPQSMKGDAEAGLKLVQRLDTLAPGELRVLTGTARFYYFWWTKTHSKEHASEVIRRDTAALKLSKSKQQRALIEETLREVKAK